VRYPGVLPISPRKDQYQTGVSAMKRNLWNIFRMGEIAKSFSFCESVTAIPLGKWHIRKITKAGKKTGGGIDTPSLCGLVRNGWDLETDIIDHPKDKLHDITCKECLEKFRSETTWV
jgi:hypothetical protein